jgi:sodium transport system permease protein
MIWHVYKKELLDSFRDRKTILLGIFIPIAMIMAMVLVFENVLLDPETDDAYRVAIETDDDSFEWFRTLPNIEWIRTDEPEEAVRSGTAVASVRTAPGFLAKVHEMKEAAAVQLMADQGSLKGSGAVGIIKDGLGALREQVLQNRLAILSINIGNFHMIEIEEIALADGNQSLHLASMILPLMVIMAVMIGGQSAAVELFAGEKERKTMEALLMTPVSRSAIILAKWLAIATLGFTSGIFAVAGFVVIVAAFTEQMKQVLDFGDQLANLVSAALVSILFFSLLMAAIQIIFSLLANNFKEAQAYFGPVMFIALAPYFILIGVGVNELKAIHFLIPVMNTFAFLKELVYGMFSFGDLVLTLLSTAFMVAVMYAVAAVMFRRDKWVLGNQ